MSIRKLVTAASIAIAALLVTLPTASAQSTNTGTGADQAGPRNSEYQRNGNWNGRIIIRGGYPSWNGYRGWNERRAGHRFYRGYWFPTAAFAITIAPRPIYRTGPRYTIALPARHVAWCENRYRTYRISDNSYAYKVGQRTSCKSPYWR